MILELGLNLNTQEDGKGAKNMEPYEMGPCRTWKNGESEQALSMMVQDTPFSKLFRCCGTHLRCAGTIRHRTVDTYCASNEIL